MSLAKAHEAMARKRYETRMTGKAKRTKPAEVKRAMREIYQRIEAARIERDISVDELSAGSGVNYSRLYRFRQAANGGITGMSIRTLVQIAFALDVSLYELFS